MADEYILKSFDGGAQKTSLTSAFTIGGTTLAVSNGSTFPDGSAGPFVIVVDRGLATEEKYLIDTTSGANGTTFNIQQAGYDGTSASAHSVGAVVEHCLDAYTIEQANRYVNLQTAKGDLVFHNGTTTTKQNIGANNTALIADSTVSTGAKWSTIGTATLADGSVTAVKVATDAVETSKIADGAVSDVKLASNSVSTIKLQDGAVTTLKLEAAERMPVGAVLPFAGTTAPTGYAICDGSAVSRTGATAALFAVIGTTYGSGNGTSTFNLPNLKGRVAVGFDTAQADFNTLGKTGGATTHTLTSAQIPGHTHSGTTDNGLTNGQMTIAGGAGTSYLGNHATGYSASPTDITLNNSVFPGSNHDHTFTTDSGTGGNGSHNNLQPYIALNYIIKT